LRPKAANETAKGKKLDVQGIEPWTIHT